MGYTRLREIPGRGICGILKYIFTWGIVYGIDEWGYQGRWCYDNPIEPVVFLEEWNARGGVGDPNGRWIKYKGEGGERSRVPFIPDDWSGE
jgi:hypothetical protein